MDAVAAHQPDVVLVLPCREVTPDDLRRLAWSLEVTNTELLVSSGLLDVAPARATVLAAGSIPVLHVRRPELHGVRRVLKDTWERLAALVALILCAPLLGLLVLAIRRESAGPAIFRQVRVGRGGRAFTMLKLRTMATGAEARVHLLGHLNESDGILFKVRSDPRVTRLGALLRKYSLDELPQLWNIVRGDMSLVGPRPALPDEVARYESDAHRRMAVKPGLTGLWQVSGRSDLTWRQSVRLDLHYVDNWSLGLDLRIIARTARAVLSHAGAY
jgi:exopolysaccharide biosynthesis polyprenyl glycosylphosphotransferase